MHRDGGEITYESPAMESLLPPKNRTSYRYEKSAINDFTINYKSVGPRGNCVIDSDDVIDFSIQAAPNEMLCFPPNAFQMKFRLYLEPKTGETDKAGFDGTEPPLAWLEHLGFENFFKDPLVFIDGQQAPNDSKMIGHSHWLTHLQYAFSQRDKSEPKIPLTDEHYNNNTYHIQGLQSHCTTDDYSDLLSVTGSFLVYPFVTQMRTMRDLVDLKIPNSFLHPSARFECRITRRRPFYQLFYNWTQSQIDRLADADLTDPTKAPKAPENWKRMKMKIEDIRLNYISYTVPNNPASHAWLNAKLNLNWQDIGFLNYMYISPGNTRAEPKFALPGTTKLAYLGFAKTSQIQYTEKEYKMHAPFFTAMPNLQSIKITVNGEYVFSKDGLTKFGVPMSSYYQNSSINYVQNLYDKGIWHTNRPDSFFDTKKLGTGLNQVIVIDLMEMQLPKEGGTLLAELNFYPPATANWNCFLIGVSQIAISSTKLSSGSYLWSSHAV